MIHLVPDYILNSLKKNEFDVDKIKHILKKQIKHTRRISLFASIVVLYMITSEMHHIEQDKKIETIKKQVEELKYAKGD